jgi:hypothetical protein
MKRIHQISIHCLTIWTILLLMLAGCSGSALVATSRLTASPTEEVGGLSPAAIATLRSLEKLDGYPFYVMHYAGEYQYPQIGSTSTEGADFSCSLFAALGEAGDKLYGRNFDWDMSPALLLFTDPPDGYASASMVNLEFIGIRREASTNLTDLHLLERIALLSAPSMPFDGMNEYGLTVGMAAVPGEYTDHASYDPSKPSIGSIGIIRMVLDHARDVDEALEYFEQYNIDFRGGPLIHYLVADPGGKAVLVEFYLGEMKVLPNEAPWHLATNHMRCIAEGDGGCPRYRTISERLTVTNGQLDPQSAMQLLSEVKQGITQWSAIYNMSSGDINVAIAGEYDSVYNFHLDLAHP